MARRLHYTILLPDRSVYGVRPAALWHDYVLRGWLEPLADRPGCARVRSGAPVRIIWRTGAAGRAGREGQRVHRLVLVEDPPAPCRTNAEVVDRQWIYADGGTLALTEDERLFIAHLRRLFEPHYAATLVQEYLAETRRRRVEAELVRTHRTQIVVSATGAPVASVG